MKKVLFLFLLAFTTLGISGCGGASFSASEVSFTYQNTSDDAYSDQIPDQTISERNKKYGLGQDPCTNYGEKLSGLYQITNNTKQYMVDTPVLVTLLDSDGNKVAGYNRIMFVTMGPKSTSYGGFDDTVDSFFKLGSRGNWESTGEKRDNSSVDSCKIKPEAPAHVKDASGVKIEVLSNDNVPESLKSNITGDIDTKVKDTYQDEPVRTSSGGRSGLSMEWLYNTDISFEDIKGTFSIGDKVNEVVALEAAVSAIAYNEWGEDIKAYALPAMFIAKEVKEVVGYGMGLTRTSNGVFKAGKSGSHIDIDNMKGIYIGTSNKTKDLTTTLYIPVLTTEPLFSNDTYNQSKR